MADAMSRCGHKAAEFSVTPSKPGFGDLSCNVPFLLAKSRGRAPFEIAQELAVQYKTGGVIAGAEAHPGGYLNFSLDWGIAAKEIVIEAAGGGPAPAGGGPVTVEHTSVNPNKALHIGHVRNIVIGDSVARILSREGYKVSVLNYIDDSGLQVADIILGFTELGIPEEPPGGKKFDQYCGDDVYAKAAGACEEDPGLKEKRAVILRGLEDGTSETAHLADRITRRVLDGQLETCWGLGVQYDCLNFESQIVRSGLWDEVFERLKKMGLLELEKDGKNAGCWVFRSGTDDKVVVRSDGTATYIAKDIPYAAWKLGLLDDPFRYVKHHREQPGGKELWETTLSGGEMRAGPAGGRVVTVIDTRQSRLQQIIASLMGRFKSDEGAYVHLGYESVSLSPGTAAALGADTGGKSAQMSGRRGLYVNADTVLGVLAEKARAETSRRNPEMDKVELGRISADIASATIRYEMARQDLNRAITFDMEKSLSLEGDTASYIQYSHARAARVMEKAGAEPDYNAEYALLEDPRERALLREIGMFGIHLGDAAGSLSPKIIARYCHGLAVAFNGFYEHVRVIDAGNPALSNARLCLVRAFMHAVSGALYLIGISAPDRM
ncbi:arginyl-tRNA synthetase [Cenarchaeum symbiosum A]|uniref:arginine--tRNA ligase n=1 Tax=Cenarchaeum symbiosum (strain A) TaxID=414004 RepID=A0RUG6_CENSY|nr:arginyl-tRNA synthetase [Cenarchaeum symbiosum A]